MNRVVLRTGRRTVDHTGDASKRYPENKETVDHSAPFLIALALLEANVEPSLFTDQKYSDPEVLGIVNKVEMEYSKELDKMELYPAAEVEVEKTDGSICRQKVLHPRGHPMNPMSNDDVKKKLLSMAVGLMPEAKAKEVVNKVYDIENLGHASELTKLT